MSWRLVFKRRALVDLREIGRSIGERAGDPRVGRRWAGRLRAECAAIAARQSLMGRSRTDLSPGLRSIPFENYLIFLRYREDACLIVAIIHGARDIEAAFIDRPTD